MAASTNAAAAPNGAAIGPHTPAVALDADTEIDVAIDPAHHDAARPSPPTDAAKAPPQSPAKAPPPKPAPDAVAADGDAASASSATTSLAPSLATPHVFRGRAYQSYAEGRCPFPAAGADAGERARLELAHAAHVAAMHGRLFYAPLPASLQRILDLGTGTGRWAIEMAERFPSAAVLGNDLAPVPAGHAPPNVAFEVDDVEAAWTHAPASFDFVHARALAGAVRDWPRLLGQCRRATRAGGWCEVVDYDAAVHAADDGLPAGSALRTASARFIKALQDQGAEPSPGPRLEGWMKAAGFADVRATKIPLPVGAWPADARLREVGAWNLVQIAEHVEGLVNWVFGRLLGESEEAVARLCEELRVELLSSNVRPMFYMYDVYGRVPDERET